MTAARRSVLQTRASTPEDMLRKAMAAASPAARARWARQGLACRSPLDRTTQAMLLRQLYLSLYETRRFARALAVALQALELRVLDDVLHQDAARAALAAGDVDAAVAHLRMAARRGPASRRPFHLWTLGGTLFMAHR
ncbi:MAG: tetratricopeptide repeat protein, partial [Polyangiaceae bacterium]